MYIFAYSNEFFVVYVQFSITLTTSLFNIFNYYPYLLVATCLFAGLIYKISYSRILSVIYNIFWNAKLFRDPIISKNPVFR